MTKVVCSQDGDTYRIECQGHATGSELVCAAVSVLMTTLAGLVVVLMILLQEISALFDLAKALFDF